MSARIVLLRKYVYSIPVTVRGRYLQVPPPSRSVRKQEGEVATGTPSLMVSPVEFVLDKPRSRRYQVRLFPYYFLNI